MKLHKVVTLREDKTATVNEFSVADVRHIVSKFGGLSKMPGMDLLTARYEDADAIIGGCIEFSDGSSLSDLSGSELEVVITAMVEVNQSFFRLAGLAGLVPAVQEILSTTSTASVIG